MTDQTAPLLAESIAPRLAVLRALAEHGTVTGAAEALGMPQPTASRWLAALGEQVGTPVVARAGRGIRLTRAGEHLADAARRALAALEAGARHALDEADPARGRVVLGFLHTMGGVRVPELLRGYLAERPGVRFTLVQSAHEDMVTRLRSGELDLALTSPLPTGEPDLACAALDEQPIVLTVHSGHRLAGRRRIRLSSVAGERFVGMKAGFGLRRITDELCARAGFTPALEFEGEEVDTLRGLVAAGLGVALLPSAEPHPSAGTVELPVVPRASRKIGLVWTNVRPLAPAAGAFREFVLAH